MKYEKLLAKVYYKLSFRLESPLSIGNTFNFHTDHDVILDNNEKPFIPATTLAGVMLNFLNDEDLKKFNIEPKETSKRSDSNYKMCPLFFSNGVFKENHYKIISRDGVALGENKSMIKTAKYDYLAIDKNSLFESYLELTIRENRVKSSTLEEELEYFDTKIQEILTAVNQGYLRFGFKQNRGFGKVFISKIERKEFSIRNQNLTEMLDFDVTEMEDIKLDLAKNNNDKYTTISTKVKLLNGISIREYQAIADQPDFKHISSGGVACIPGTSLNGAVRAQMVKIHKLLNNGDTNDNLITKLFGTKNESDKEVNVHASNIIVEESYFEGGKELVSTRSSINRFSGGSLNRALFTEVFFIDGTCELKFIVKECNNVDDSIGLLLLALQDLTNGLTAIGGQTSIGRGILLSDEIYINDELFNLNSNLYVDAYAKSLTGGNLNDN